MFNLTYLIIFFVSTTYLMVQSIFMVPYMAMYIYTNENDFNVVWYILAVLSIVGVQKCFKIYIQFRINCVVET